MASSSPNGFDKWAVEFLERESAWSAAQVASWNPSSQPTSPLELVRHLYLDKLRALNTKWHAYSERGSIHASVLLHRGTVKELFPVASPEALEQLMGISLPVLRWCVDNRLVMLIIQHPELYRELTFLHPLLQGQHQPACYELRDRYFYHTLASGNYEALVGRGLRHPVLGLDQPFPDHLREPYELVAAEPAGRPQQRNAQRYAALAALMGADELDEALAAPTTKRLESEQVNEVQARFYYLHRRLLHPVSQGIGGAPYALADRGKPGRRVPSRIAEAVERSLTSTVLTVPSRVDAQLIETVQTSSIPDRYERLEREVLATASETVHADARDAELADDIASLVNGAVTSARLIDGQIASGLAMGIRFVGIGAAAGVARQAPELSVVLAGAAGLLPTAGVVPVLHAFERVFGRHSVPWQYWTLQRRLRRVLP